MTAIVDQMGAHGPGRSQRHDQQIFIRAKRHSRTVRRLRILIPVVMATGIAAISLVSWLDPMRVLARLPLESGRLVISGSKITMEAPKLAGFTKDARAYEVTARAAAQDITKPDLVELTDIRAKIEDKDKSPINLTAVDGLYNRKSGQLTLSRDVILITSAYQVNLVEAQVDTTTNNVVSNHPVQVKMLQGDLRSNRLEVQGGGEVVTFIGDVKLRLDAPADEPKPTARR